MPSRDLPQKIAVLSHVLPPSSSGQAVVLYRVLRDWDAARYCLISTKDYRDQQILAADRVTHRLPAVYHHLPAEAQFRLLDSRPFHWARRLVTRRQQPVPQPSAGPSAAPVVAGPAARKSVLARLKDRCRGAIQWWDDWVNVRSQLKQRAKALLRICAQEKCTALVACSGDLIDIPAAFLAAQWMGIPFFPYMFDDYSQQWTNPSARRFAWGMCPQVIGQAAAVIVPNEFLARAYQKEYGVEAVIVRNPLEVVPPFALRPHEGTRPHRIVFTGTIYEAHFDAFTNLLQALRRFPDGAIEFHIYTSSDPAYLANHGVAHPAILHSSVSSAEAIEVQQSADLLFLPLAFDSPYPEVINTSAPGKVGEYLASSRPVLVHVPKESFLSWYCRSRDCAAVVDVPDANLLHVTLTRLMQEPAWGAQLAERGWQCAHDDFRLSRVQEVFAQLMQSRAMPLAA
jgi:hypothetical protein